MQDPFGNWNNQDPNNQNNGSGPNGLPIPPNYATIVNKSDGNMRIAKVGFSWTSLISALFLVPFAPAIFRADWYNMFCMIGVQVGATMIALMTLNQQQLIAWETGIASIVFGLLWGFLYNMMYFKHSFNKGYVPADDRSKKLLEEAHYL
ncbi:hypothetical protein [Levilactobacillus bambusae]|uniref:DUF2628 domain-containing protein n=1 Tax=Levilactobacillus bambusae TaxID=2024736 RepID=A0A2V1MXQ2_9LACO|nr:hypothetical protein [Levilactobacillus bambusae]PWF99778.1 hypothetical protein DCM90_06875 [Levilactobacillus bambusae]